MMAIRRLARRRNPRPVAPLDAAERWDREVWARASDLAARMDAKLRRCGCCGEWCWDRQDCAACGTAVVERQVS